MNITKTAKTHTHTQMYCDMLLVAATKHRTKLHMIKNAVDYFSYKKRHNTNKTSYKITRNKNAVDYFSYEKRHKTKHAVYSWCLDLVCLCFI